ncbi:MAG: PDZ domain-containing protein, partial [Bacteroidota bacterium]
RDFFYAPNMHGVDWKAMRDQYAKLLPHVRHRNDLTYVIGELIGELNVGHAYISGGDRPTVERIPMGLLGARYARDASGYYKITEIIKGANWSKPHRSPLTEPGVEVSEGDYIIAINGQDVSQLEHMNQALIGTADQQTELLVNDSPKKDGARRTVVVPRSDEADLYYHAWVRGNIEKVTEMSDGRIGYVHVPDMSPRGLNEFVRYFYPQLNREALIIDVRGNGGGNVSPMIIERLQRKLAMIQMGRNLSPYPNPFQMVVGPKVMLHDRYSASDGDLVNWRFKAYDLGPTIGERSWGGVVGIRGSLPFIDGADLRKPEFAPYDTEGKNWIIEGYGVDPDIEVVNAPHEEYKGKDAQLERSVEELKKLMKQQPTKVPPIPPYPDRARQPKD